MINERLAPLPPYKPLLDVEALQVTFRTLDGPVPAVRGVDLRVTAGETVGVVGETGCGKSATAAALLGLIPTPPARVTARRMMFNEQDLLDGENLSTKAVAAIRGHGIAMIFQDPSSALNPVFRVGDLLSDVIAHHQSMSRVDARQRAISWLDRVGLPRVEEVYASYPHQLSGGMKQRVAIAMALATEPALVIADEPTTALDVTIQAQVLDLMRDLQKQLGLGMLFITHDLEVVARMCHRVLVMYAGRVVEEAPVNRLLEEPRHPYTVGLLGARPGAHPRQRLAAIAGNVPPPSNLPHGCAFHPRCSRAQPACEREVPLLEPPPGLKGKAWSPQFHQAACYFPVETPPPGPVPMARAETP